MHAPDIFTGINGALAIAVGAYAIWKFPKNVVNRTFGLLAFATAALVMTRFLPFSLELINLATLGILALVATLNFHFIKNLIGVNSERRFLLPTIYATNLFLFGLLAADQLNLLKVLLVEHIWFAGFFTVLALPIFLLIKSINIISGIKKYQLRFILFEYCLALVIATSGVVLNWSFDNSLIQNIATTPHLLSGVHLFLVFYLFVEWKFLKLKIIAPKILKRAVALAIAIPSSGFVSLIDFGHAEIYKHLVIITTAVLFYTLALRFFEKHDWFTTVSLNNFKKVVEEFKNQNIFYASIEELEENIRQNFSRRIGIEEARVTVLDLDGGEAKYPELEKYFSKKSSYLVTAEEQYLAKNKHINCPYLEELESLGDVCFPLFQNTNELIGFFAIRRTRDDIYIKEELKLLEGGVHYIALSLMAILYTEKLRQQATKLREDYEKLKTLDDAKDAFIANVSHELRTPATAIKGYAEMLTTPNFGKLNDKQKDFTKRIEKNTNWLLALLTDILEITKLENGQISFNFKKVRIHDLLTELAEKWQSACKQKKLGFSFDFLATAETEVETDPEKLREIIGRLLGNAHKFTENGGVKLLARTRDGFLELEVEDTGIGIPPEKTERIWDKFSQSADFLGKGDESSGLGLAIVKKLVENLNGSISVHSELAKGSVFKLLIPLQNA
ncbi:MAG: HAMP domain-containing histidine kinase [Candidatus Peribacteraceae bacterium]|nr:HAMP domain-containing histidine kinase [Candidatus Peribacteraceae bacterium]